MMILKIWPVQYPACQTSQRIYKVTLIVNNVHMVYSKHILLYESMRTIKNVLVDGMLPKPWQNDPVLKRCYWLSLRTEMYCTPLFQLPNPSPHTHKENSVWVRITAKEGRSGDGGTRCSHWDRGRDRGWGRVGGNCACRSCALSFI